MGHFTIRQELSRLTKMFQWDENTWSCIHVVMVLFFYLLSFTLTTVIENQFYLDKACEANFELNRTFCDALTEENNIFYEVEIQKYVATFSIYNNLVRQVLPILPGFMMAAWSDAHGSRAAIIIGMVGKTVYFMGYMLNAHFFQWPLEYVLLTAALPRAIAGYDIGILMAVRTHISEATPPEKLSHRLAFMEMVCQIAFPVGYIIGSTVFTNSGRNYFISFFISTVVAAFGLLYGLLLVTNFGRERSKKIMNCNNFNLVENIKHINNKKTFLKYKSLYILLFIMFLHSMMNDFSLLFLYTQLKFRWNTEIFSYFQTVESVCGILISALLSTLTRFMSDMHILFAGISLVIVSRLCYGLTNHQWVMYLGAFAASFQVLTVISVYSIASKIIDIQHRGKFFVIFTSIQSATSLLSSPLYSYIYSATISSFPSTIFFISVSLQCLMLIFALYLKHSHKVDASIPNHSNYPLHQIHDTQEASLSSQTYVKNI